MPERNGFLHQVYPVTPASQPILKTLEHFEGSDGEFSSLHTQHRIDRVILVHGTFMGDDPFGITETLKSMAEGIPKVVGGFLELLARNLEERTRTLTTSVAKDIGNYPPEYRDEFQRLVGDDPRVELLNPTWSSQNHHSARADLAVRLVHQLIQRPVPAGQRVLLWGHSHAGNGFALLTNLLANDRVAVEKFFEAAGPQIGEHWQVVRQSLKNNPSPHPLASSVVIASFATPVRYGWDTQGCSGLIHVTFHRPHDAARPGITKPAIPTAPISDIFDAKYGDWVQAFAIAGTDVSSVPTLKANENLTMLLESNLPEPQHAFGASIIASKRVRDAMARWQFGTRCHADGLNMLVDYAPSGQRTPLGQPIENALLGHGVATTLKWLPAHLKLFVDALSLPGAKFSG